MAFLQICRRHQVLFKGASYSVERFLIGRSSCSCRVLHVHVQSKLLRSGKEYMRLFVSSLEGSCLYIHCLADLTPYRSLHMCLEIMENGGKLTL